MLDLLLNFGLNESKCAGTTSVLNKDGNKAAMTEELRTKYNDEVVSLSAY